MSLTPRWALSGLVLVLVGPALARGWNGGERPAPAVPRKPFTKEAINRREAQRLYGAGVLYERQNRLVEALRAFERAQRLDPESAAVPRALFGLYLALDRTDDALAACRKVLRLEPDDCQTAFLFARQLRGLDRRKEAVAALEQAAGSPRLKERPDLAAQVWFDLGVLHEEAKSWAAAEKAFRQVVAILDHPEALVEEGKYSREEVTTQAAETYERIGRICLNAGRIDAAVKAFEEAKKKDALRAPRLAYNLAQVYRDRGRPREALAQLEVYLKSQPQGVEGYEMKIALQRQLGRAAAVLPDLEWSSGRDPNNVSLKLLLAREYRKAGRYSDAQEIFTKLLQYAVTPEVYRGQFELYQAQQGPGADKILTLLDVSLRAAVGDEEAKVAPSPAQAKRGRAMLVVLRSDPSLVRMLIPAAARRLLAPNRKLRLHPATRSVLATLAARTRLLPEAEQLYRSCLDQPGRLAHLVEAEVYVGLLKVLRLRHKPAAVVEVCKRGLREAQQTNRVFFHQQLVWAHLSLDNPQAALAAADAMVNEAGTREEILGSRRIRVDALVQAGKTDKALAECQAMLKQYNQGGELRSVRASLSSVYQAMGKHDEAEEQLRLILQADPTDATANNDLGYVWADRNKNLAEAERLIRKALELDRQQRAGGLSIDADSEQDNAAYVDSLGWVLFRRGRLEEACRELEKASGLPGGDDDPVVWDHLGDVYFRLKKPGRAAEAWKKALSLYDVGARRKTAGRPREIQEKIRQAKP
jgi:tetratricopeptide (TPR) repeat protein